MRKIDKIIAISRWVFVEIFVGVLANLTQWFIFPFAWMTRNIPVLNKVFWIWMDDDRFRVDGYAEDYRLWLKHRGATEETFWLAYKWHLRNKMWNLISLFKVPNVRTKGPEMFNPRTPSENNWEVVEYVIDNLHHNDEAQTKREQYQYYFQTAGLKYIPKDKDDNIWQVNEGDVISIRTSIIGTGFIWYKVNDWYSFKYSQCKLVNYGFWKGWRTIKMGTNERLYSFTMKHQPIKPWE